MSHRRWSLHFVVATFSLLLVVACSNDNHCAGNPNNDCRLMWDAAIDTVTTCTSSAQCTAPTPACDTSTSMCVECVAPDDTSACTGTTPVCGTDRACRSCATHGECASGACLPDGSCAEASQIAYVSSTGTGTDCSQASPCALLDDAVAKNRPYVKIAANGAANDSATVVIDGKTVTILAEPGATLDRDGNGPILEVRSTNADVRIYDLRVSGATGVSGGDGIVLTPNGGQPKLTLTRVTIESNQGTGISSTGGTLTVTQSTVSANTGGGISTSGGTLTVTQSTVLANTGGGISISAGQFDISNNVIAKNGNPSSTFGGVLVSQVTSGTRRFDFNTVANNGGSSGTVTGVVCSLVTQAITFSNNIVYGNQVSGGGTQVGGSNCSWTYSDIGPDAAGGTGNINMDPLFANPSQNNFHILADSPAKDVADPAATVSIDIDGDARPQGTGKDMGADEYTP